MKGRLYIDGNDAYLQYGVYVVKGGWNELVAMPPLKSVDTNDWQEEDGVEADLSDPVLNTREVQVKFAVAGLYSRFRAMVAMLSDGAYHEFDCEEIGRKYKLRLVSEGSRQSMRDLETTTLKFADDFPLDGYTYLYPTTGIMQVYDYIIDGSFLSRYGVRVLRGSLDEVKKNANVKTNLLRNINTQVGAIYDNFKVTFKSKDVKLTCLMRADSLTELWRNYDALLYDLIRPYTHVFYSSTNEAMWYCYYKQCSVSEFYPDGKIWLKFALTLTFSKRVPYSDVQEAIGTDELTDTSEEAKTRYERIAAVVGASVTEHSVVVGEGNAKRAATSGNGEGIDYGENTQTEIDDSIVLATEDAILVFTENNAYAIDLMPGQYDVPTVRLVNDRLTLRLTGGGAFRFND